MRLAGRDWFVGLAVVLLAVAVTAAGGLRGAEGWVYDRLGRLDDGRSPSADVVIVAVDDASLERLGSWPWSRYTLAEIHALVARGDPAVVGYTLPLETPQNEHARKTLRGLLERNGEALEPRARQLFRRAIRDMGTDRVLAAGFEQNGRVVLGARFRAATGAPASLPALPEALARSALPAQEPDRLAPLARFGPGHRLFVDRARPPVATLAAAASGVGLGPRSGRGDVRRMLPLALPYRDRWLPSLALLVYGARTGAGIDAIRIRPGDGVEVAGVRFATGPGLGVFPTYYARGEDGTSPFRLVSAADVHAREVPAELFRGRAVVVGVTAPSLADPVATPAGPRMPVEVKAAQVSALLEGHLNRVPDWALYARLGAFGVVALYLMFLLPRLRAGTALSLTGLLLVAALSVETLVLVAGSAWIPLVAPAGALVLGHGVLGGKRAVAARIAGFQRELTTANRELAEAHREAGRLEDAFRCLRACHRDDTVIERLYALGLDLERRRRFAEAAEAFRACERDGRGHRDAADRAARNERLQQSAAVGTGRPGNGGSTQTLIVDDPTVQKPMLGRYQLERELGRGAMGTVYLGRDPRIGREVAIKTMPLDREFEGQSLEDMKRRFLREAETAGRLSHPNIVTIHDIGEEQGLAWIAMDYLPGTPMIRFCEPDRRLPPAEVFEVMAQVADALAVAHAQHVIHRDIKPDNIVYDRESGKAVVTDFGVACLLDQRHTRSGTILGSPSYMSPEQLAARDLDGRADLFSVGVTLYQLLAGELPFVGDSLSNLMYRIANERQRELRRLRPELPTCATTITNRCMEKDPDARYVSAEQLARALRRCRAKPGA